MAKRFTDTDKWKDEWFTDLEPALKIFWVYLCDNCDHAGIWKVNFKVASSIVGCLLDKQSTLKAFGDRIIVITSDKWMLSKFIPFQYPKGLSHNNSAHRGVLKLLEYNKIEVSPYLAPAKALPSPSLGAKDKDKDKVMDKVSFNTSAEKNLSKEQPLNFRNPKVTPDQLQQLFNDMLAMKGKIVHCRGLSGKNIQDFSTTTSYEEFSKIETWKEIFTNVGKSEFLMGVQQGSSFVATLNWLICHDNALKVLNGQYGGGSTENASNGLFDGIKDELNEGA